MLTIEQSNEILKRADPWENALAMKFTEGDIQQRHSDFTLKEGSTFDNVLAMRTSEGEMQQRHSDLVLKEGNVFDNALAMDTPKGGLMERHEDRVNELMNIKNAPVRNTSEDELTKRREDFISSHTDNEID